MHAVRVGVLFSVVHVLMACQDSSAIRVADFESGAGGSSDASLPPAGGEIEGEPASPVDDTQVLVPSKECTEGAEERRSCGPNARGVEARTCRKATWSAWSSCVDTDVCLDAAKDNVACGPNLRGTKIRSCDAGHWSEFGACTDHDSCRDGALEMRACGSNARGTETRTCAVGAWSNWQTCSDADVCRDGEVDEQACGTANTGRTQRMCTHGQWVATGCVETSDCSAGDEEKVACGFNARGASLRTCVSGRFGDLGPCVDPDTCTDGAKSTRVCGTNARGEQERKCVSGQWTDYEACADLDECKDGAKDTQVCGLNGRGSRERSCDQGRWSDWSACVDADACKDGVKDTQVCGLNGRGSMERSCGQGGWSDWSECADADTCKDGAVEHATCGLNQRGNRQRACDGGRLTSWSECVDTDACRDEEKSTRACGPNGRGTLTQVCRLGLFEDEGTCSDSDACIDGTTERRTRFLETAPSAGWCLPEQQTRTCTAGAYGAWNGTHQYEACEEACGNGRLDGHESCDDRNTKSGDGCSYSCAMESGFACPLDDDGLSRCTPCVVLVDGQVSGVGANGTTWKTAFPKLQLALAAASQLVQTGACSNSEVWVARGIYYPGEVGDRTASFVLGSKVQLYGGFDSAMFMRDQRTVDPGTTVLSGDLAQNDTTTSGRTENAYNVVTVRSSHDLTTRIDGITIRDGYNDGASGDGAGVLALGSLTLANVIIAENVAFGPGGGASLRSGSWALYDVRFLRNESRASGGGLVAWRSSVSVDNLLMRDVGFEHNRAGRDGGGFAANSDCDVSGIDLVGNVAAEAGGAAYLYGDGRSRIDRAFVHGNAANRSGGLLLTTDADISNTVLWNNEAELWGGALDVRFAHVVATNLTIYRNESRSGEGGGAHVYGNQYAPAFLDLRNSIVWGNSGRQLWGGGLRHERNCVEGFPTGASVTGDCNVGATPFADPGAGDLSLSARSQAIDWGNNQVVNKDDLDLGGYSRVVGAGVDLGAYEYQ